MKQIENKTVLQRQTESKREQKQQKNKVDKNCYGQIKDHKIFEDLLPYFDNNKYSHSHVNRSDLNG